MQQISLQAFVLFLYEVGYKKKQIDLLKAKHSSAVQKVVDIFQF